jgi:hypothetical protein
MFIYQPRRVIPRCSRQIDQIGKVAVLRQTRMCGGFAMVLDVHFCLDVLTSNSSVPQSCPAFPSNTSKILPEFSSPDRKVCPSYKVSSQPSKSCFTGPFQPKNSLDSRNTPHFLGMLPSSPLRNHVLRSVRPTVLDASNPRL